MAATAYRNVNVAGTVQEENTAQASGEWNAAVLLAIVEACLHGSSSEWIFLKELRVGTGFRNGSAQRLDAFALNCLAHTGMKRVCYEAKVSRADFLCELKNPLKRRIGMRYSNEFYFVTPEGLLDVSEVPIECGLVEVSSKKEGADETAEFLTHFDAARNLFCRVVVPAPWRETPGPTWQFVAGMLRNQQRVLAGKPPRQPNQQKLPFAD